MRRRTIAALAASVAAGALVVGIAVVWPGLDAQETPEASTSVWALQTGDGRRYARVNTAVGELDTVRSISNPDAVVSSPAGVYLFSDSFSKITRIDEALPADLDEEALRASDSTPPGTIDVAASGDRVAYLTDSGTVYVGILGGEQPRALDPFPSTDEDAAAYTADAVAIDDRGVLFAYSRADASVLRYDIGRSEVRGRDALEIDEIAAPAVTAAGDTWAVVDGESGRMWLRDAEDAPPLPATGAMTVAEPSSTAEEIYVATETALVRVAPDGSGADIAFGTGATVLGIPARPIQRDGEVYAAWLPEGTGTGILWGSDAEPRTLDYGGESLGDERRPVFVDGGGSIILNETRSGWAWTVPDGQLVPSSQNWSLDDRVDPDAVPAEEQLPVQLDPKPPVAEPDAFGVRAGSLSTLPVLMNDHDPNEDVLSIDPTSVTGLDPGFGTVTVTDDAQRLAVRTEPGATGSATFSYRVTDGTTADGLASEPTTVTLTVVGEDADSAPVWCGVERCLVEWPAPEVARGGTVTVPILPGWVDPESDPLLLLSVVNRSGIGSVAATPSGDVVYQHSDDGAGGEQLIDLAVTVSDTVGNTTERQLVVRVSPQPRLAVESFAVRDVVGGAINVDVAPYVSGTTGSLSLESVRVLDDAAATATVTGGTTGFDFTAREPGTYRVDFTVTDGSTEATGTTRITLLPADAPAELATSPVVAFVHPQEDATLDIFAAVSNPTRRVLLLSDVTTAADPGAVLSVDAVGQNQLRVSGSTASGEPGRLGTVRYVVSDGTEDQGASVEGEATVYLLPPAPELAPIAVDDRVVVRAGAQIDIPVLANDVAPAGGRPTLNPASVVSSSPDALAFASSDVVRYLAPQEPGDYTITYSVYTTGAPSLADDATVRVRVLDEEANRPPVADTLEGRVLSGQTTRIDFDGFGVDPDGDGVTLDRILEQPERGAATIAADGAGIVYTSVPGDRGQVTFRYRVVDAFGATGEGTVRVGVLDGQTNPSPITYTDYVQVQASEGNSIRVSPLANDVDPTLGSLTLTDVRPDLPETDADGAVTAEYTRLAERILSRDDTSLEIEAGTEPATMSFLYDLESSSGNTARGRIVVRVVRESVPDYPIVSDTVLTAETREDFVEGVDVLDGKATWASGDVGDLDVALWGDIDDVDVAGTRLRGELPERTRLIPFRVSGEGASGEIETYAFLRVPGDADLTLALRAGAVPPEVNELESVVFDMADLVARPRGSTVEIGPDIRASGARGEAVCSLEGGTRIRYDAGAGAPWSDSCRVPVRLAGTEDFSYLSVPIIVVALDPQPELRAGSLTVGPGETATFDLRTLTTWQLREDWDGIQYALDYGGVSFDVSLAGSTVTVTGKDDAVPGRDEAAVVTVPSHAETAPGRLILRVGAAPSTLPRGGSVAQQCSQAAGSSCSISVVGASGEVNPLPRTPLELTGVRPTGECIGVSFSVASATTVTASWSADAPGATCSAAFTVRDAQGRATAGDREGRLLLDLQGYPKAPASIGQVGFENGSVTLRIDPGAARSAYPGLSGFVVRSGGAVVAQCSSDGVCPSIPAPNGEQRQYDAVAVNAVGESRSGVRTTAWAYAAPNAPGQVRVAPVQTRDGSGNVVSLVIDGVDPNETGYLEITSPAGETQRLSVRRGQTRVEVGSYRIGTNTTSPITITPFSRFDLPPGLGGSPSGGSITVSGNGVGAPRDAQLVLDSVSNGDGTSTVTARATARLNGDGSSLRYGIVREGERCQTGPDGATASFPGLTDGEEYRFVTCVESVFDDRVFGRTEATASVRAQQSGRAPRGYTFAVDPAPNVTGQRAEWVIRAEPTSDERVPNRNRVEFGGFPSTRFGADPEIAVRYVHEFWGTASDWARVTPRSGSAPYQVQATWGISSCIGGGELGRTWDSSNAPGGGRAAVTFSNADLRFYDASGARLERTADSWTVPNAAVRMETTVTVDWSAQGWGLQNATATVTANCTPTDPPPPAEPEPEPEPAPNP